MEQSDMTSARHAFFQEGQLPSAAVRHSVLRSWLRCSDLGLAEARAPTLQPLTASELRLLHQRHDALRRLCRPELEMIAGEARDTGSVAILTDSEGMILDTIGDAGFASRAAELALRPGVSWKEASTGTNAIGTALAERRAIAVNGSEHFFSDHRVLSCAATPITDPRGALIGALDLTGSSSRGHGHALGLIRLAVDQIEHRLFRRYFEDCRLLRYHSDPAMLGTSREGILVFREDRLVAGNRRGLSLAGLSWDALDEVLFETILSVEEPRRGGLLLRLSSGAYAVGHWDADHALPRGGDLGLGASPAGEGAATTLEEREVEAIAAALAAADGNISKAARHLGIHRSTIHRYRKQGLI
ncbi:sigma-54-dependent Fis family transcriptional regulator [Aureimonas sp. AU20]|uniref:sigma-54-dependent Fis family transcriptional regulator n=1 Tax=Aureimonas sp. AU20 TaxID=1349819 RepID=UPI000785EE48|nr:GAF domain-containing protein [Aureimonas sp. AU20]